MEYRNRTVAGKRDSFLIFAATFCCLAIATPVGAEVYRWVDEEGKVHYSESLPPNYKDQGHDVLNERGIVLDEDQKLTPPPPPPPPTEEEITKAAAEKAEDELPPDSSGMPRPKPLYSKEETQRRMDAFMLLRYDSEQEIVDAMNVEIKQLDYDRRLMETTRASVQEAYRGQVKRAAQRQRAGMAVEDSFNAEIKKLKAQLESNNRTLSSLQKREENIREDFQKQRDRYRYLLEMAEEEAAEG
jgi:hypothetical protein